MSAASRTHLWPGPGRGTWACTDVRLILRPRPVGLTLAGCRGATASCSRLILRPHEAGPSPGPAITVFSLSASARIAVSVQRRGDAAVVQVAAGGNRQSRTSPQQRPHRRLYLDGLHRGWERSGPALRQRIFSADRRACGLNLPHTQPIQESAVAMDGTGLLLHRLGGSSTRPRRLGASVLSASSTPTAPRWAATSWSTRRRRASRRRLPWRCPDRPPRGGLGRPDAGFRRRLRAGLWSVERGAAGAVPRPDRLHRRAGRLHGQRFDRQRLLRSPTARIRSRWRKARPALYALGGTSVTLTVTDNHGAAELVHWNGDCGGPRSPPAMSTQAAIVTDGSLQPKRGHGALHR